MDGDHQPLEPTELAVRVKNSCQPGTYCFVYHPRDQPNNQQDQPNNQPNNQQDQPAYVENQPERPNNQRDQPNNQRDRPNNQRGRCPTDPPPAPPVQRFFPAKVAVVNNAKVEAEEESLISL